MQKIAIFETRSFVLNLISFFYVHSHVTETMKIYSKSFLEETKQDFTDKGYIVVPFISQDDADDLAREVILETVQMVFKDEQITSELDDLSNTFLFTDLDLRKKKLSNPRCIWRHGNTREPIISKSTGMISMYLNENVRKLQLSDKAYELISNLYGDERIVFKEGFERFSIKAYKSAEMPRHIDDNLDREDIGLKRVQSLVVGMKPTDVKLKDSGTIEMIPYFHHYFRLVGILIGPDGPIKLKDFKANGEFQVLGTCFDTFLPEINSLIYEYTQLYNAIERNITPEIDDVSPVIAEIYEEYKIEVPTIFQELRWEPIDCQQGDMIAWDSRIPHRSLKNSSRTPRVAFYISYYPVTDDWYQSSERHKVIEQLETGKYIKMTSASKENIEEYDWRLSNGTLVTCNAFKDGLTNDEMQRLGVLYYN